MNSRGSDYLSLCQLLSATISKTVRSDVNFFPLALFLALEHMKYRINFFFSFEQLSPGGERAGKTPRNQKTNKRGHVCVRAAVLRVSKGTSLHESQVSMCPVSTLSSTCIHPEKQEAGPPASKRGRCELTRLVCL